MCSNGVMPVARIRTIFTGVAGTPWYSNQYFLDDGATPVAQDAADWVGAFWTGLAGNLPSGLDWSIEPLVPSYDEATGDLTAQTAITSPTGGGSNAAETLPFPTQGLIRLRTEGIVNNRAVHGRIFVPGPGENVNSGGVPSASYITALQTAIDSLLTSSVNTLCVWARPFAGDPLADPPKPARAGTKHAVMAADVWTNWAVMRSRRD